MAVAKAAGFPNSVLRTHPLQYPRRPPQVQQPVPGRLRAILWRRAPVNAGHSLKLQAFELVRGWIAWKSDRIDRPTRWTSLPPGWPRPRLPSRTTPRSEEHTSELQSLMRILYAVLRFKKK